MNSFSASHYAEPLLEFGGTGRHVDVRFGLMDFGPVDFSTNKTKEVRLGVVGSSQTSGKLRDWLRRCEGHSRKEQPATDTFPSFPRQHDLRAFQM
jgi:hypothetical protein